MQTNKSVTMKPRRRIRASRKWTYREITKILRYAVNTAHTGSFEKPTLKQYYIKLARNLQMDVTWDLLKSKMFYLRRTYDKAEEWLKTVVQEGTPQPCNIRDQLLRICPHYDMLKIIYLQKQKNKANKELEGINSKPGDIALECDYEVSLPEIKTEPLEIKTTLTHSLDRSTVTASETQNFTNILNNYNTDPNTEQRLVHNDCSATPNVNSNHSQTANLSSNYNSNVGINQSLHLEEARENNRIENLNVDLEMAEKHFLLEERKLDLEERKFSLEERKFHLEERRAIAERNRINADSEVQDKKFLLEERKLDLEKRKFNLEERKADRDYELRKLELEMKERLIKYEYDLKYSQ